VKYWFFSFVIKKDIGEVRGFLYKKKYFVMCFNQKI